MAYDFFKTRPASDDDTQPGEELTAEAFSLPPAAAPGQAQTILPDIPAPVQAKPAKPAAEAAGGTAPNEKKDKYSIYLSKGLSAALRMESAMTRSNYSALAEEALSDRLFHRFRCGNPACYAAFSVADTPVCCPVCGQRNIEKVENRS